MFEGTLLTPTFSVPDIPNHGLLVIGYSRQDGLSPYGLRLDRLLRGTILRSLESTQFAGNHGDVIEISTPKGEGPDRVLCVGLGDGHNSTTDLERLGGKIYRYVNKQRLASVYIALNDALPGRNVAEALAHLAFGLCIGSYSFDRYLLNKSEKNIESIYIFGDQPQSSQAYFDPLYSEVQGILMARELTMLPPSDLTPMMLAERAQELEALGVEVTLIKSGQLIESGFATVHAVGRGSAFPPCVAILKWRGSSQDNAKIGLAGKGVTFDAGGMTLKPASQQPFMKYDMGGAAAVLGALYSIADQKMDVDVIGVIGLAENLPGPEAYKTGDILKMRTGVHVEVTYPDAEGRLILADLLTYLVDSYELEAVVDAATLTGTVVAAIGENKTGLFSNSDDLTDRFQRASIKSGEAVWRLPMDNSYLNDLSSPIADFKNMPAPNSMGILSGSASVAASFLNQFTRDTPFVHLDIGGSAWSSKEFDFGGVGPTGAGARLLSHFIKGYSFTNI